MCSIIRGSAILIIRHSSHVQDNFDAKAQENLVDFTQIERLITEAQHTLSLSDAEVSLHHVQELILGTSAQVKQLAHHIKQNCNLASREDLRRNAICARLQSQLAVLMGKLVRRMSGSLRQDSRQLRNDVRGFYFGA